MFNKNCFVDFDNQKRYRKNRSHLKRTKMFSSLLKKLQEKLRNDLLSAPTKSKMLQERSWKVLYRYIEQVFCSKSCSQTLKPVVKGDTYNNNDGQIITLAFNRKT